MQRCHVYYTVVVLTVCVVLIYFQFTPQCMEHQATAAVRAGYTNRVMFASISDIQHLSLHLFRKANVATKHTLSTDTARHVTVTAFISSTKSLLSDIDLDRGFE